MCVCLVLFVCFFFKCIYTHTAKGPNLNVISANPPFWVVLWISEVSVCRFLSRWRATGARGRRLEPKCRTREGRWRWPSCTWRPKAREDRRRGVTRARRSPPHHAFGASFAPSSASEGSRRCRRWCSRGRVLGQTAKPPPARPRFQCASWPRALNSTSAGSCSFLPPLWQRFSSVNSALTVTSSSNIRLLSLWLTSSWRSTVSGCYCVRLLWSVCYFLVSDTFCSFSQFAKLRLFMFNCDYKTTPSSSPLEAMSKNNVQELNSNPCNKTGKCLVFN